MIVDPQEKIKDVSPSVPDLSENTVSVENELVNDDKKMKYLIADTAAFIKNVPMFEYAHNVISIRDVIDEIRDKETRQRLLACPIEIEYKEPDANSMKKVIEFSKKTGDFGSLSATDIKVLALTYMLEASHVGTSHLKETPNIKRTTEFYNPSVDVPKDQTSSKMPGFFMPSDESGDESEDELECDEGTDQGEIIHHIASSAEINRDDKNDNTNILVESLEKSNICTGTEDDRSSKGGDEDNYSDEDNMEEDDEGWITPYNYKKKKEEMEMVNEKELTEKVEVACMTSDFAMQNVLISMGLHVASPTGQLIKETKTWILRCYACFKTTPHIEKKFCPKCGNKTLKRVSVTLNADGTQQIHISTRRQLNKIGKKFSLPKPIGGKYAVNPILCEDQQFPQQRKTQMARAKNDPMNPDFISRNSAFVKHDVTSVSALMGVGKATTNQYWLRKNPNAVGKNTGNRKKKKDR